MTNIYFFSSYIRLQYDNDQRYQKYISHHAVFILHVSFLNVCSFYIMIFESNWVLFAVSNFHKAMNKQSWLRFPRCNA